MVSKRWGATHLTFLAYRKPSQKDMTRLKKRQVRSQFKNNIYKKKSQDLINFLISS